MVWSGSVGRVSFRIDERRRGRGGGEAFTTTLRSKMVSWASLFSPGPCTCSLPTLFPKKVPRGVTHAALPLHTSSSLKHCISSLESKNPLARKIRPLEAQASRFVVLSRPLIGKPCCPQLQIMHLRLLVQPGNEKSNSFAQTALLFQPFSPALAKKCHYLLSPAPPFSNQSSPSLDRAERKQPATKPA